MTKYAHKQCWQCKHVIIKAGQKIGWCKYLLESLNGDAKTSPVRVDAGVPVELNAEIAEEFYCDFDLTLAALRELDEDGFVVTYAPVELWDELHRQRGDIDETLGYPERKPQAPADPALWARQAGGAR